MEEQNKPTRPDSHLALAIITTVMCCLPLGIVAIIKSTKVDQYYNNGDYSEARQASEDVKKFSYIGMGISAVFMVIYFILIIVGAVAGAGLFDF